MQPGRGEYDEDIVDRIKASGSTDPLTIEAMQELVYVRSELAKQIRDFNKLAADNKRKATL